MNNLALRTTVSARLTVSRTSHAAAAWAHRVAGRVNDRVCRQQTGQDIVEYAGMLVLVAAVIAILFALNLPQDVGKAVSSAVNSIFSGNSSDTYSAPTVTVSGT